MVRPGPDIVLVTYADGEPFSSAQRLLDGSAAAAGAVRHVAWEPERLARSAREMFGSGMWSYVQMSRPLNSAFTGRWWKPFIIMHTLHTVAPGSWVAYQDCSRHTREPLPPASLSDIVGWLEDRGQMSLAGARTRAGVAWSWRQSCFKFAAGGYDGPETLAADDEQQSAAEFCRVAGLLGFCPEEEEEASGRAACCSMLERTGGLQSSWSFWKGGAESVAAVKLWLEALLDAEAAAVLPFGDQSALELVAHQFGLPALWMPGHIALGLRPPFKRLDEPFLRHIRFAHESIASGAAVLAGPMQSDPLCWGPDRAPSRPIDWLLSLCRWRELGEGVLSARVRSARLFNEASAQRQGLVVRQGHGLEAEEGYAGVLEAAGLPAGKVRLSPFSLGHWSLPRSAKFGDRLGAAGGERWVSAVAQALALAVRGGQLLWTHGAGDGPSRRPRWHIGPARRVRQGTSAVQCERRRAQPRDAPPGDAAR
ncbi:unnamed protein product [Prorocentrum cordatum]|uniref:Uncharacterized protein n=1 Tax=Prorocentrum cordatum TaxID=2364126 RepID=A0ABN9VU74_9DINO|nr:unnamed protein product [Polarella glacialis]